MTGDEPDSADQSDEDPDEYGEDDQLLHESINEDRKQERSDQE